MTHRMASSLVKSVRISPELWAFVEARAAKKGISANAWLVRCVEDAKAKIETPDEGPKYGERLKKR